MDEGIVSADMELEEVGIAVTSDTGRMEYHGEIEAGAGSAAVTIE